jgi:cyclic pyranopterin phosphate synthase
VTGGEPLVRKGGVTLVRELKGISGVEQVTMTTNGVLLGRYLEELIQAGIDGINISLDTLDAGRYEKITGKNVLPDVMENIERAVASGVRVKLNTVLQSGVNEDEWESIALLASKKQLDVRFIEMMPIGFGKNCRGISGRELLERMKTRWPDIEAAADIHGNGPAVYYHVPGWKGSIGLINAIHGKFCASCNRIRLTSRGKLKPCLCFGDTVDLMPILRSRPATEKSDSFGDIESEDMIRRAIAEAIAEKPAQHCFEQKDHITEESQMVSIGG